MTLVDIYSRLKVAEIVLYQLLQERTPEQSISHKEMPSWEEHVAYLAKHPVPHWYLIQDIEWVGSIYLSRRREVGISIFRQEQRKGYGTLAVMELMRLHPGELYANVNPLNCDSHAFFRKLGGKIIQATYELGG